MYLRLLVSTVFVTLLAITVSCGQEITLKNPSFECVPMRGGSISPVKGWVDCGRKSFPRETAADIHPANLWENTLPSSEGNTYLGLVVRDNESWESVAQILSAPLKANNCYTISLEVAQSAKYISKSREELNEAIKKYGSRELAESHIKNHNYSTPTVLRIWGGSSYCDARQLLAESDPVSNRDWKTYHFKLKPKHDLRFLVFEAFYNTPVLTPYNGHILLDNISSILKIDCDVLIEPVTDFIKRETVLDEEEIVVNRSVPRKNNKVIRKKFTKNIKERPKTQYKKVDKKEKPIFKSFKNIDKKKIEQGQILEMEKVFFDADTSSVDKKSFRVLNELYLFLNENKNLKIEIGGHTNSTPSISYCDRLSTARAKVVADYLVNKGIDSGRIAYKGYGKRNPIATNKTKKGRKKNQRVEVKIIEVK